MTRTPPVCLGATAQHGFTLVELMLVLALLVVATALVAPSLSKFFRGRALDSEARQLLSLTHAAQSRAVSEGFPMLLWLDAQDHSYGVVEEAAKRGAQNGDPRAEDFPYDAALDIEAPNAVPLNVNGRSLPAIRFLPDGTVDETSAARFRLASPDGAVLWLVQATNRMSYAIIAPE